MLYIRIKLPNCNSDLLFNYDIRNLHTYKSSKYMSKTCFVILTINKSYLKTAQGLINKVIKIIRPYNSHVRCDSSPSLAGPLGWWGGEGELYDVVCHLYQRKFHTTVRFFQQCKGWYLRNQQSNNCTDGGGWWKRCCCCCCCIMDGHFNEVERQENRKVTTDAAQAEIQYPDS